MVNSLFSNFFDYIKDQSSANLVKEQLRSLSLSIGIDIQPVFRSKPVLRLKEKKPAIVNNQFVAYQIECDQCDAVYVRLCQGSTLKFCSCNN